MKPNGRRHHVGGKKPLASKAEERCSQPPQQPEHKVEDVYVRYTDKDGGEHVQEHRVWNRALFLQARARDAVQLGGEARAEQITREQYEQERLPKRRRRPAK